MIGTILLLLPLVAQSLAIESPVVSSNNTITIQLCTNAEDCGCREPNNPSFGKLTPALNGKTCQCRCGKSVVKEEECTDNNSGDCEKNSECYIKTPALTPKCHWKTIECAQFESLKRNKDKEPYCMPNHYKCNPHLKLEAVPVQKAKKKNGETKLFNNQCEMVNANYKFYTQKVADRWAPIRS